MQDESQARTTGILCFPSERDFKRRDTIKDRFRINNRIRAREVRLIAEDGEQVGIIDVREAQRLAEERELDLVEVAPNANPPVCRLMDYGKFRYEQSKKDREARKHQKQTELKEVRLRPKTDEHDIAVKAKRARRFLQAGDKVKFTLRFRGRELAHTNIGREILDQLIEQLRDIAVVEQKPSLESRALSLILAPNTKTLKAAQQAQQEQTRRKRAEKQAARMEKQAAAHAEEDEDEDEDDFEDEEDEDEDEDDFEDEEDEDEDEDDFEDEEDEDNRDSDQAKRKRR
jgi:translation initiation factor IF-3